MYPRQRTVFITKRWSTQRFTSTKKTTNGYLINFTEYHNNNSNQKRDCILRSLSGKKTYIFFQFKRMCEKDIFRDTFFFGDIDKTMSLNNSMVFEIWLYTKVFWDVYMKSKTNHKLKYYAKPPKCGLIILVCFLLALTAFKSSHIFTSIL